MRCEGRDDCIMRQNPAAWRYFAIESCQKFQVQSFAQLLAIHIQEYVVERTFQALDGCQCILCKQFDMVRIGEPIEICPGAGCKLGVDVDAVYLLS